MENLALKHSYLQCRRPWEQILWVCHGAFWQKSTASTLQLSELSLNPQLLVYPYFIHLGLYQSINNSYWKTTSSPKQLLLSQITESMCRQLLIYLQSSVELHEIEVASGISAFQKHNQLRVNWVQLTSEYMTMYWDTLSRFSSSYRILWYFLTTLSFQLIQS